MSDTKDNDDGGFLRKVVRFVSHPATDWADLGSAPLESQDAEEAKLELKAAIERRKRNDFVRRREFDMLRKVRREGLSESMLDAVGPLGLDSEVRLSETVLRSDIGQMKAKIDAIEQQMVGDSGHPRFPSPSAAAAPRRPAAVVPPDAGPGPALAQPAVPAPEIPILSLSPASWSEAEPTIPGVPPSLERWQALEGEAQAAPEESPVALEFPALQDPGRPASAPSAAPEELKELPYDPELDDAVFAFANANFSDSERRLQELVAAGGERTHHADTWLVLFDLYRMTGQQAKFEALASDYASRFGLSAPQWLSPPVKAEENVPAAASAVRPVLPAAQAGAHDAHWVCPETLDAAAVEALDKEATHFASPWRLDWSPLQHLAPEARAPLYETLRQWSGMSHEMHWLGGGRLQAVLQELTPHGVRDVDPMCWQLRLEMLRLLNRPDRFDEVAIDYCLTYEVSPPPWEPARCRVQLKRGDTGHTLMTHAGEVTTIFVESQITLAPGMVEVASVDLSGQWVGDISGTLKDLQLRLGGASVVRLGCTALVRVDFNAAGDLLNWVMARRAEGRTVAFEDAHRLLALFFGAMGITEHAQVKVRKV